MTPQNIAHPTLTQNITQKHYSTPSKNNTTSQSPTNPLSNISNIMVTPQNIANSTLTHNNTSTHYPTIPSKITTMLAYNTTSTHCPTIPSKNTITPPTPPNPLSDISNFKKPSQNKTNPTTWKRLHRPGREPTSDNFEVLGQKRLASNPTHHTGLPNKKIVVSRSGKENVQILAEAVYQPCQK